MLRAATPCIVALALTAAPPAGAAGEGPADLLWQTNTPIPTASSASAILFDADGDALPDLLVWAAGRKEPWVVAALEGSTGDVLWSRSYSAAPTVCALEGGAGGDRVFVAVEAEAVVLDGADGDVLVRAELPAPTGPAAAGDLDGDGIGDVVVGVGDERDDILLGLSGVDLTTVFRTDATPDESRMGVGFARPAMWDSDGDGRCEIYLSENTDVLTRVDPDGRRVWSVTLDERTGLVPKGAISTHGVLADVTGDGHGDLCVGCLAGRLAVLDPETGGVVAARRFGRRSDDEQKRLRRLPRFVRSALEGSGEPVNGMLAVELDGRPGLELVFGCGNGRVYAYAPSRDEELWDAPSGTTVYDPPTPCDLNGDGTADLVAWHYNGVVLIDGRGGGLLPDSALPEIAGPGRPAAVFVDDVDGDGAAEVVLVERGAAGVFAWTAPRRGGRAGAAVGGEAE